MKSTLCLAFLAFVIGTLAPTGAVTFTGSPVHVTTCEPSRNVGYMGGGWRPAYYPSRPYYWPSVYGYSYYQPPVRTSNPTLSINYSNATDEPMKQIEFGLVANGNLVAEVKDVGTFSPGASIKHEFGLSPNVFPLSTAMAHCVPLKITFADGTKWRSPHLPRLHRKLGI